MSASLSASRQWTRRGACMLRATSDHRRKERPPRLRDGPHPFMAHNLTGARHILTISVRYFGSRAAISFPFSAISSGVGFGGGDERPGTGNPTARKNSFCPAGVHMQSMRAVLPDYVLKRMRGVGRNIDGRSRAYDVRLSTKSELEFAFEQRKHFLEVVAMRRRSTAGRH